MKIFFDHQTFSNQNYGGVSRYIIELVNGINKNTSHEAYLSLLFSNNIYLTDSTLKINTFFYNKNFPKKESILYRINEQYCRSDLMKKSFDIFHATYYDPYFINLLRNRPFVITFHDMIHEKFSTEYEDFSKNGWHTAHKKKLAEKATKIIAVSNNTKKDLIDIFNVNPEKIHVVYHGSSLKRLLESERPIIQNYILYVGNRQRYKNFDNFLYAIAPVMKQYKLVLICAGGGKFDAEEINIVKTLNLTDHVKQQFIHDDNELWALYKSAITFAFPSKYEGFGIPILEAFACGCPCMLSNSSSLPEVAGDAALYFEPNDKDSIRSTLRRMLDDSTLRDKIIQNGYKRLESFSWDITMRETLAVYEMCI